MGWLTVLGILFLCLLCAGAILGLGWFIYWIYVGVITAQVNEERLDKLCESYKKLSREVDSLRYRLCDLERDVEKREEYENE